MNIKRLQTILRQKKIDIALIMSWNNKDPNLAYLAGVDIGNSFLIVPKRGRPRLITSKLEFERARKYSNIKDVKIFGKPAFGYIGKIAGRFKSNVGINKSTVSLKEFRYLKKSCKKKRYIDIEKLMLELRKTKSEQEIKKIRKACSITDRIFKKIIGDFRFRTEQEIVDFMKKEASEYGCELSFDPIVASAKNASMPHYRGGNVRLKKGFLVMDFGVNYKGYLSDMTRTIYIGNPTDKERKLYNILLKVQKDAIKISRPGMKASELVEAVDKSLGRYAENMIHGLGHGIGVEIHELPSLHSASKDILKDGDIFTIEPGLYFENRCGIRIEDDILLREGRVEVLTRSPKSLITRELSKKN